MFAPGGIASLVMMNLRVASFGRLKPLLPHYVGLVAAAALVLLPAGAMIEMVYHLQLNEALGPAMKYLGLVLDAKAATTWVGAGVGLVLGLALFEVLRRRFVALWNRTQEQIEAEIRRREAAA